MRPLTVKTGIPNYNARKTLDLHLWVLYGLPSRSSQRGFRNLWDFGQEVAAGGVLCSSGVVAGVEGHARQGVNGQRTLNQAAEPATRLEICGRLVGVGDVAMLLLQKLGGLAFADARHYDPGNGPCNNQPRERNYEDAYCHPLACDLPAALAWSGVSAATVADAKKPAKSQAKSAAKPQSGPKPTLADVPYGTHPKQVLDFYKAESLAPTPLVFYIHGGGWMGGSKAPFNASEYLKAGISVVSIEYRFVSEAMQGR